jgi:hypothetical protein
LFHQTQRWIVGASTLRIVSEILIPVVVPLMIIDMVIVIVMAMVIVAVSVPAYHDGNGFGFCGNQNEHARNEKQNEEELFHKSDFLR